MGLQFGKFRVLAELGHGGMADVFLAMVAGPAGFTKLAVVKRLRSNLVDDVEFITMLVDEARITARLNHPNVVQTLEVGTVGEEYYLAMEYIDGQPLHRLQRRAVRAGAPLDRALEYAIAIDALAGLHHAHELADYDGSPLHVVHRDVTPQNILITYDGQVKVVDFGVAKAAGRASETRQGVIKGKVRYMSPEQAAGRDLDRRSDLFAVGILVWEAATGQRFWGDRDDTAIAHALIEGLYEPSPRAVCPDVPEEIDAVCRKALARDPEDRYATAADFARALEGAVGGELVRARSKLGAKVAELFGKERAQLRTIIGSAGKESRVEAETFMRGVDSLAPMARSGTVPAIWPLYNEEAAAAAVPAPTAQRRTRRASLGVAAGVAAALAIIGLSLGLRGPDGQAAVRAHVEPARAASVSVETLRVDRAMQRAPHTELAPGASAAARAPSHAGAHAARAATGVAAGPKEADAPRAEPEAQLPAPPPTAISPLRSASTREAPAGRRLNLDTGDPWANKR